MNTKNYMIQTVNEIVWTVVKFRGMTFRFRGELSYEAAMNEAANMAEVM